MNKTIRHILNCKILIFIVLLIFPVVLAAQTPINSLSAIIDPNGHYVITAEITGGAPGVSTFNGILEANIDNTTKMPYRIKNLNAPLFETLTGTVKNLVLENVGISGHTGNTGAIACTANGNARIYNVGILSGEVGGTGNTGGLVGLLDGTARVINCYSYADITDGSVKAGIVGYNNYASKYDDLRTMVMNCMFYGDIVTGGSLFPIYGGTEISNDFKAEQGNRLNNYNYFLYEAPFSKNNSTSNQIITAYNCALAAEERFLIRFEFYRHLLNSTRELATWYVTGSTANAYTTMHKWVLDKEIAVYPILKEYATYPSIVNYDPTYTFNPTTGAKVERANVTTPGQGGIVTSLGTNGSLTINIELGSGGALFGSPTGASITTNSIARPIIDKDTAQFNFNYGKVQLPYYNEVGAGNYTDNRVVTGWKIISMEGGTAGGYTETNYDTPHYNYADRDHIGKDLYGTSGRIFAQGAYFNVPTGVTAITIQPYWAKCAYLSDACYDRYGYNTSDTMTLVGGGYRYTNGDSYNINGSSQKVYTTFAKARDGMAVNGNYETDATVYDYAVVLVGNYHHHTNDADGEGDELSSVLAKPLTVTSIDNNRDNEPDYCLIFRSGKQKTVGPIRYDFITLPGMAMAHKMATHNNLAIPGNCKPLGWFEITTTGLIKFGQFEHSFENKTLAPLIFMGGVIDQFVSNNSGTGIRFTNKTRYFLFGDNVWFQLLSDGTHADKTSPTPHRPISITGGQFDVLYLSGYFRPDASACTANDGDRNAECYIDGGKFGEVAGAGQEKIDGNVTWMIDHADMKSFYGGGINSEKAITGNIHTTIKNSNVTQFCGGPKFGNMTATKTVITEATGCTFGTFFGGGYGGTSIYRDRIQNEWTQLNYDSGNKNWVKWVADSYDKTTADSYRGKFISGKGVSMGYDYEFFGGSKGNVARLYIQYASFSLAQVNNVTSTLSGCTVLQNYYGGGSFGAVMGDAVSTLNNCTVYGNVFAAGYSVQTPTVRVLNNGGFSPTPPYYNTVTAVYEGGEDILPAAVTYTWAHGSVADKNNALVDSDHTIITNEVITGLGKVEGNATLTLKGSTTVGTNGDATTGNVFGGGDESAVAGNTTVILEEGTTVLGNVYGGGNEGPVGGNSEVKIQNQSKK